MKKFTLQSKIIYFILVIHFVFTFLGCKNGGSEPYIKNGGSFFQEIDSGVKGNHPTLKNCGLKANKLYRIKKLVDGDTFWLDDGCDGVKIRLIGIDAPESKNMFGKIKEEPFGKEAAKYLERLVDGKKIRVQFDVDSKDKYGRTLAYCYTDDGIFLNKKMVEEGMAMIMTVPKNVKYQEILYNAQKKARDNKRGMWRE